LNGEGSKEWENEVAACQCQGDRGWVFSKQHSKERRRDEGMEIS